MTAGPSLLDEANAALLGEDLARARSLFDQAAEAYAAEGDSGQAASAMAFSSRVARFLGDLATAQDKAAQAVRLAGNDRRALAAAWTALAEAVLAQGHVDMAAGAFGTAAAYEHDPARRAMLLRRRGAALWGDGAPRSAAIALEDATRAYVEAGDPQSAIGTLVERATALAHLDIPEAAEAIADARAAAEESGRRDALAAIGMVEAARSLAAGDVTDARESLEEARQDALDDVDPLRYAGVVRALAEVADAAGDQVGAYAALASGWVTLGDLLGESAGRAAFRPGLLQLYERWGAEQFAQVKAAYEESRQAQRAP